MDYQNQVKIITNIEANVPVNLIEYNGMKIWPIVRLAIWQHIFDGPSIEPSIPKKTKFTKRLSRFLRNKFFLKKNNYRKADAVFLVAPNERRVKVDGKYYSPVSNSLQELLSQDNASSVMLDLGTKKLPVYGETYFINKETVDSPILDKFSKAWHKYFFKSNQPISGWDNLIKYMRSAYPEYIPNRAKIINYCESVIRYENIFTRILKKIRPKVGFLVCYYHPAAMGYIQACRKLSIKTIDVQHGDQYGMYRNWYNLPPEGYELMPDAFWCWGQESADGINAWSSPAHPQHKAFVGGNPWVSRFTSKSSKDIVAKQPNKVSALVALTNMPYPVDNIVSAIKNSPTTINWTIRPHPAMPNQVKNFMNLSDNVTINDSPLVTLFEMFEKSDFMITPCSTAAYEALVFKVHPIITHPDGLAKFSTYIKSGLFSYADTASKILEIIAKDKTSFSFKERTPYMETDLTKIKNNLLNLIRT